MSRLTSVAFFGMLLVTAISWIATVAMTATLNESDQAGNGLSYSFAMIGVFATWTLLAVLLLFAFRQTPAPGWAVGLSLVAVPLGAAACLTVINLLKDNRDFPAQWPIVVLVVAPLLLMAFALWACVPSARALMAPMFVHRTVFAAVILLSIVPFPLRGAQKKRQATAHDQLVSDVAVQQANEQQQLRARFEALTVASSLSDVLAFISNGSGMRDEALAKARTLVHRQENAIAMLRVRDESIMGELRNLNLEVTPELCTPATEFLRLHALDPQGHPANNNSHFLVAAQYLDKYVFGMQWLAERGCAMRPAIDSYRATAMLYPDSPERQEFLDRLAHFESVAR